MRSSGFTVSEHPASSNGVTLKSALQVIQDRWTGHHLIDHIRVPIGVPL